MYAFGIVLWEVFTRAEVYEGLSAAQIIAKVANEGLRPKVSPAVSRPHFSTFFPVSIVLPCTGGLRLLLSGP